MISQERTPCLGTCASYRLEIYGNGTVMYEEGTFVAPSGVHSFTISNNTINQLIDDLDKTSFITLDDRYGILGINAPSTFFTVQLHGKEEKGVVLGVGDIPEQLMYLQTH